MESKDFRLILKNLPLNISSDRLKKLIEEYGTVTNVDLKEKNNLDDKKSKFAFINVTTTNKQLNTCFKNLNNYELDGCKISIDLAKESFLDRLKREREEALNAASNSVQECIKPQNRESFPELESFKITSKNKKRKFDDDDLNTIANTDYNVGKTKEENKNVETFQSSFENNNFENSNDIQITSHQRSNQNLKQVNNKIKKSVKPISESEKKRLLSVKEKSRTHKEKEWIVKNALKFLDDSESKMNKKIVFNDFDEDEKPIKQISNGKHNLFDNDDEDDVNFTLDEEKLDSKARLNEKLFKLQSNIGNDERFKLDERFLENEETAENKLEIKQDVGDEKAWQLDILENVLGKPIRKPKPDNFQPSSKMPRMVHYDPTASNHQDFEIKVQKPDVEKPVKKKKKMTVEEIVPEPIPISKEIYYDVSQNLVESLKPKEEFSLLKTLGRENIETKTKADNIPSTIDTPQKFAFDFGKKNPFKYDSSDDEREPEKTERPISHKPFRSYDDKFFIEDNDPRFEEAITFFKKKPENEIDNFNHKRREIKEIVRKKLKNNIKKKMPWRRKKIRLVQKKVE